VVVSQLLEKAREYLPPSKVTVVERAYDFANRAHDGQMRRSGDPYIEHPLQTAMILAELELDASSLAAALLHDVTENCGIASSEIEVQFGSEVARLVDATTKLGKISRQAAEDTAGRPGVAVDGNQAENLRKMLVAMAEDLRVVFIKLADRLHNMRTLYALSPDKQQSIARETLEIYAPLAHRLGIWEIKWQLEDLCFRYLEPDSYHRMADLLAAKRADRERVIAEVSQELQAEFQRAGLRAEVTGRPKHLYSIHNKMERYAALGKDFDDIHDLLALRVVVESVPDCYSALGVVHSLWHPLPEHFDDYIANPKPNGYQSLHSTVMCHGTTPLEVQIRTHEMHHLAEFGVAVHWRYKEGGKADGSVERGVGWLRQLIEWHRELRGAEEFLESVRTDVFSDQVFVYTPKGEIKDLPRGATPLDFAYRIHTDLGHRCVGAKVNGRIVPLNYELANGDIVQILTTKSERGPSRDWLNANLGYIKTSHAREKIRQWFKKRERTENVERGRELLEKLMRQLGLKFTEAVNLARLFKYDNVDEFYNTIGYGGITTHQVATRLAAEEEQQKVAETIRPRPTASAVRVLGVGDMLTHLAQCCHPLPGDDIVGYVTRSRGVTIHRKDCPNIVNEDERERLIRVDWGRANMLYPVRIKVDAWDRVGLMRDISTLVAEEKVNIVAVNLVYNEDQTISVLLTIEIGDLPELSRLLTKIERIRDVLSVMRLGEAAAAESGSLD